MKKLQKNEKNLIADLGILRPNLYDRLKIFAVVVMIIDHIGYYLFPEIIELRLIGRFAFPIFLFLVGFNGSYRWRWSLLIVAITVQLSMGILQYKTGYGSVRCGNILFVIVFVRILLSLLQKIKINFCTSLLFPLFVIFLFMTSYGGEIQIFLGNILDYGIWGFLLALGGFFARKKDYSLLTGCVMLMILMGIFAVETTEHFKFYESWMIRVILFGFFGLVLIFYILVRARQKEKNLTLKTNSFLDQILLFISRNTLWIYGGHILVLILIFFMKR